MAVLLQRGALHVLVVAGFGSDCCSLITHLLDDAAPTFYQTKTPPVRERPGRRGALMEDGCTYLILLGTPHPREIRSPLPLNHGTQAATLYIPGLHYPGT